MVDSSELEKRDLKRPIEVALGITNLKWWGKERRSSGGKKKENKKLSCYFFLLHLDAPFGQ